eukprot:SAG31_NODE_5303_length_2621_cov_1.705393_2_plen_147_part_00
MSTLLRLQIPDMVDGDERTNANANIGACQGAAFFIGSYLTGMLSGVDPRLSMGAAAIASTVSGLFLQLGVPETIKERSTFEVSKANPFGFTALLRSNSEYNKCVRNPRLYCFPVSSAGQLYCFPMSSAGHRKTIQSYPRGIWLACP